MADIPESTQEQYLALALASYLAASSSCGEKLGKACGEPRGLGLRFQGFAALGYSLTACVEDHQTDHQTAEVGIGDPGDGDVLSQGIVCGSIFLEYPGLSFQVENVLHIQLEGYSPPP